MSPSVALLAAPPESRTHPVAAATVTEAQGHPPRVKCSRRYAPHAVRRPKYRLNPVVIDRSIVQIVTAKQIQQKDINL